jgi:hypothetical protein
MSHHNTPPETPESKRSPERAAIAALQEWAQERPDERDWEIWGAHCGAKRTTWVGVELSAVGRGTVTQAIAPSLEIAVREALDEARGYEHSS